MQKAVFTTATAVFALTIIMVPPAQARYLQTDPIGYQDNINLYAYVANDPVNSRDPTGLCDLDANGNQVGICSDDLELQSAIDSRIVNPNSNVGNTETLLVASGQRADGVALNGKGTLEESATIVGPGSIDGVPDAGLVLIGMQESKTFGYIGDSRVETLIPYTVGDAIEHEFGSHMYEILTGEHNANGSATITVSGVVVTDGAQEARAVNRENEYRQKSGSPYRRTRYDK